MPIYEFRCPACGKQVEYFVQTRTFPKLKCTCQTLMEKVPSVAATHFKGTGFYENDYKKKS